MEVSDPQNLSHLLDRIKSGDKTALSEIYDLYGKLVYSVSLKILQQTTDAEEATQDAFLGLWKNVDALHGKPQKILPWLIRVVRNKSIDLQRKSNRRVPSSQVVQTPENTAQDSRTSESLTALDVLIDSEQSERIKNAMDQLPADQKIVIELAYFKGFSQTEIAEDLGEPLGTIKSRARYALTRLRKEMEDSHVS